MSFTRGITLFQVNNPVLVENISTPGFDQYILSSVQADGTFVVVNNLLPGQTFESYYSTEGTKVMKLRGEKTTPDFSYALEYSITFDVGRSPNFSLEYQKRSDQDEINYPENYVVRGTTFNLGITQGYTATSPVTYSWLYGGAITYSSPTASNQILAFNTVGIKNIGLTQTNRFATGSSQITFRCIDNPAIYFTGNPTFGNVPINTDVNLNAEFVTFNGHFFSDVNINWLIDGVSYTGHSIIVSFPETGTKGITLNYSSKILSGLSGSTYAAYTAIPNRSIYVDPESSLAFLKNEPEFNYYKNEILKHGTRYKYLNPNAAGGSASNTLGAVIAAYESFTEEERTGPVMINCEYPWLEILSRNDTASIDSSWLTNQAVIQESQRLGIAISSGSTMGVYKQIAIQSWRDQTNYLRSRGCSRILHYATTGIAFSNYLGIPHGLMRYSPFPTGGTHYYYQADSVYDKTMREKFDEKIQAKAFASLMKSQSNADVYGAAAYCFAPTSITGGYSNISAWNSSAIKLIQSVNGVTSVYPQDFEQNSLLDNIQYTSNRMWVEFYRACRQTQQLGYAESSDIPENIAAVVISPFVAAFYLPDSAAGGPISRWKWTGTKTKDTNASSLYEIKSIFQNDYRLAYEGYSAEDFKYPSEIWLWDALYYYFVSVPTKNISGQTYDIRNIESSITRNALEIEYFGRPGLTPGNSLFNSTATLAHANYFLQNCMNNYYWNTANSIWWTGITNNLPFPCGLTPGNPLSVHGLCFSQPIFQSDVIRALKHELSIKAVDYVKKSKENLNSL
jgi:hypothetical protein